MASVIKTSNDEYTLTLNFDELRQLYMIMGRQSVSSLREMQEHVKEGFEKAIYKDMQPITSRTDLSEKLYGPVGKLLNAHILSQLPAQPIDSRVELVKQIRQFTDCGLKEAMNAADYLLNNGFIKVK